MWYREKSKDKTFEFGPKCIDVVLVSEEVLEIIEGIALIEWNEIVDSDYRGYLLDLDLEEYFNDELNQVNEREKSLLNPNRRSHRKSFVNVYE